MSERREPFLMTRDEAVTLKEAARRTRLSTDTIRRLHVRHGIGRQMNPRSPIEVSFLAIVILQHGDLDTLELLRAGRREHPAVRRYLALINA